MGGMDCFRVRAVHFSHPFCFCRSHIAKWPGLIAGGWRSWEQAGRREVVFWFVSPAGLGLDWERVLHPVSSLWKLVCACVHVWAQHLPTPLAGSCCQYSIFWSTGRLLAELTKSDSMVDEKKSQVTLIRTLQFFNCLLSDPSRELINCEMVRGSRDMKKLEKQRSEKNRNCVFLAVTFGSLSVLVWENIQDVNHTAGALSTILASFLVCSIGLSTEQNLAYLSSHTFILEWI